MRNTFNQTQTHDTMTIRAEYEEEKGVLHWMQKTFLAVTIVAAFFIFRDYSGSLETNEIIPLLILSVWIGCIPAGLYSFWHKAKNSKWFITGNLVALALIASGVFLIAAIFAPWTLLNQRKKVRILKRQLDAII